MKPALSTLLVLVLVFLTILTTPSSATTTTDDLVQCANITSPLKLVIPNSNTTTNGNSNGLAGNAILRFDHVPLPLGQNITNINITYAFCSSFNPLIAENIVKLRIRSFINQTSYFDTTFTACDNIQSFCVVNNTGCVEGALVPQSSWPIMSVVAAPQIWLIGPSNVAYGRFKSNAVHTYANGPSAPSSVDSLSS